VDETETHLRSGGSGCAYRKNGMQAKTHKKVLRDSDFQVGGPDILSISTLFHNVPGKELVCPKFRCAIYYK
jgi:hypothetical protein